MDNLLVPLIIILAVIVVVIVGLYYFTPAFLSPQEECGRIGKIFDSATNTCVSCAIKGSSCLMQQCCYSVVQTQSFPATTNYVPMTCGWSLNFLNGFRECQ